jgi:hypothetical protein
LRRRWSRLSDRRRRTESRATERHPFGLITKYALSRNAAAMARGQKLRARLAAYQGVFGLLAVAMGSLYIVWLYVL